MIKRKYVTEAILNLVKKVIKQKDVIMLNTLNQIMDILAITQNQKSILHT